MTKLFDSDDNPNITPKDAQDRAERLQWDIDNTPQLREWQADRAKNTVPAIMVAEEQYKAQRAQILSLTAEVKRLREALKKLQCKLLDAFDEKHGLTDKEAQEDLMAVHKAVKKLQAVQAEEGK